MILETTTALYNLLNTINDDSRIKSNVGFKVEDKSFVNVLMSEKYREVIALQEKDKTKKINYPIIVIYDDTIEYDRSRYYNDNVEHGIREVEHNGSKVTRADEYEPYMPYNLNYRVEVICKQRIHLDNILIWIMQNIPERGCLDVSYVDEDGNNDVYNSLLKRGPIIKADEGTSSVLYRRTFELVLTTLLSGKLIGSYTKADQIVMGKEI